MSVSAASGIKIGNDLFECTKEAVANAESRLTGKVNAIIYLTGLPPNKKNSTEIKKSMAFLSEKFRKVPMVGSSNVGVFNNNDHGLYGVSVLLISGINAESHVVKRFRLGNRIKTWRTRRKCLGWHRKYGSGSAFIFFPPGIGFPKLMVRMLNHEIKGFNPLASMNFPLWKINLTNKIFGSLMGLFMNIFGMGISYSSAWNLLKKLHEDGVVYSGTVGVDPVNINTPIQFCNFKPYTHSLVYLALGSLDLIFNTINDSSAVPLLEKTFSIDTYLNGGFVPTIDGKWAREKFLEDIIQIDKKVFYKHTQNMLYLAPQHNIYFKDKNGRVATYAVMANPNFKQLMISAPDQVLAELADKKAEYKSCLCIQSPKLIIEKIEETLEKITKNEVAFCFVADCANRAMSLGSRYQQSFDIYSTKLKEIPFVGSISGGEIANQSFPIINFSYPILVAQYKKK